MAARPGGGRTKDGGWGRPAGGCSDRQGTAALRCAEPGSVMAAVVVVVMGYGTGVLLRAQVALSFLLATPVPKRPALERAPSHSAPLRPAALATFWDSGRGRHSSEACDDDDDC
jgi:hypothetical protein